jgi:two-component system, NarL family, nitrate/nitrite response regulator NarL
MAARIMVLLIEDNRLVRDGLATLLGEHPDLKVMGAAESAQAGLLHLRATKPDVILVDAALGNGDSHRLVRDIKKESPETRVIVMDLLPVQGDVIEFVRAGANGFIVKDATIEDFVKTIRSVSKGTDVVPQSLTSTLLSHIADQAMSRRGPAALQAVRMTKRERQITDLIAEGLSNKEIAQRLNIAIYTVKSHVHNILEKLALHTRLQIAARAHRGETPEGESGTAD